jgi:type III restriction enzyme
MRLSVNQAGDRMDNPATVHQVNVLTVVTSESYTDFVTGLHVTLANHCQSAPVSLMKNTSPAKCLKPQLAM